MAIFTQRTNIILSLIIAAGCIAAAFFLSGRATITPVNAESTQELLKAYATKDTDSDGLADWQEDLYGSDPANPRSIDRSMTDKEAVDAGKAELRFKSEEPEISLGSVPGIEAAPNTLTERFAQEFLGQYLLTHGTGVPTEEALTAFVNDAIASLDENPTPSFSVSSIGSAPQGTSLESYVGAAEAALLTPTVRAKESEIFYFSDAVYKSDAEALEALATISASYDTLASAFAKVPAPSEARAKQLRTANALAHMGEVIGKMASYGEDPLLAFVGFGQYETAAFELAASFADFQSVFVATGRTYAPGETGYQFWQMVQTGLRAAQNNKL